MWHNFIHVFQRKEYCETQETFTSGQKYPAHFGMLVASTVQPLNSQSDKTLFGCSQLPNWEFTYWFPKYNWIRYGNISYCKMCQQSVKSNNYSMYSHISINFTKIEESWVNCSQMTIKKRRHPIKHDSTRCRMWCLTNVFSDINH